MPSRYVLEQVIENLGTTEKLAASLGMRSQNDQIVQPSPNAED